MVGAVTVRGRLSDARHIELDQPVETPAGPVEVVVRPLERDEASRAPANDGASVVGLFADESELMDQVCDAAMAARERDPLRTRGA